MNNIWSIKPAGEAAYYIMGGRTSWSSKPLLDVERAARLKDADALFELAIRLVNGEDLPQNWDKVFAYLHQAAQLGSRKAQAELGHYYILGDVMPGDRKEAIKWYRMAAERGDAQSKQALAFLASHPESIIGLKRSEYFKELVLFPVDSSLDRNDDLPKKQNIFKPLLVFFLIVVGAGFLLTVASNLILALIVSAYVILGVGMILAFGTALSEEIFGSNRPSKWEILIGVVFAIGIIIFAGALLDRGCRPGSPDDFEYRGTID